MGPVYGEIAAYMAKNKIPFAGPPFAMYYNMDMDDLDVEIGFPVAEKISGEGRVKPGTLPGRADGLRPPMWDPTRPSKTYL